MGTNLYGYIKGKSASIIVITAHYDHLGIKKDQAGKIVFTMARMIMLPG